MAKFRKKPVIVDAIRYDRNELKVFEWFGTFGQPYPKAFTGPDIYEASYEPMEA